MKMMQKVAVAIALFFGTMIPSLAQNTTGLVVSTCGTVSVAFKAGNPGPYTVDTTGKMCISGSAPSGAAGGDLAGTYPNPTIKPSVALTTPNIGAATGTSLLLGAGSAVTSTGPGGVLGTGAFAAAASGANPTATAGPAAVNGAASTFMRSDAAPAVQKASSSLFGIVEVDGTTITASGGVITAAGAPPTGSAGGDLTGTYPNPTIKTSVGLSGSPTTTTQSAGDSSTKIATTAFTATAINNAIAGVNPAVAVQAATTAASDTSGLTYNNGAAGIGAFFTGSVATALTVDGYTFTALGQRLLVKNDTQAPSGAFNGVYYVTQVQTGILPPILTRALDYDTPSDINNTGAIPVVNGTVNALTSWLLTSSVATVGTDALTYAKFSYSPQPPVFVAAQSVTGVSHTGDTSEFILAQIAIPALAARDSFRITPMYSFPKGGSASAVTTKIYYGATGSGVGGTLYSTVANGATILTAKLIFNIWNRTTSSQFGGITGANGVGGQTVTTPTSAVTTTGATEVTISGTLANSGDTVTLEGYTIEVLRGS